MQTWSCRLDDSEVERFRIVSNLLREKTGQIVPKSNVFRQALLELEKKLLKEKESDGV